MTMVPPPADGGTIFSGRPDVDGEVSTIFQTLCDGGVVILRTGLSYGIVTCTKAGIDRINQAKRRGPHKRQAMLFNRAMSEEIQVVEPWKRDMIDCAVVDYKLPLGVVATYRREHPFMAAVDPDVLRLCTANGRGATPLNPGGLVAEGLTELSREHRRPIFGSSANLTGSGTKFRIGDIEPEVLACADLIVDHGIPENHLYGGSATLINWDTMEVVRFGVCYDLLQNIFERHFGWTLPPDPGRRVNRNGHVDEFALHASD